ncbi:MAG: hypothetical protein LBF81_01925, partial [Prevotellaceae bacterium]|nr:hypothetical protein [Prevotellaceae bacterium]
MTLSRTGQDIGRNGGEYTCYPRAGGTLCEQSHAVPEGTVGWTPVAVFDQHGVPDGTLPRKHRHPHSRRQCSLGKVARCYPAGAQPCYRCSFASRAKKKRIKGKKVSPANPSYS